MLRRLRKLDSSGDYQSRPFDIPSFEDGPEPPHELPAFASGQVANVMADKETNLRFLLGPFSHSDQTHSRYQAAKEFAKMLPFANQKGSSTCNHTDSLKRRLTKCSSKYLMGISRLLEGLSISDTSSSTTIGKSVKHDEATMSDKSRAHFTLPDIKGSSASGTLHLPNTLLVIDRCMQRQGICIPGLKLHDSKSCWCAVAEELRSKLKLWVCETGITVNVADPPSSLLHLDLTFRDNFGNTALHLLAARGASLHVIMEAIERVHDVNAVNTAGQSFLHGLEKDFFCDLIYHGVDLIALLQRLSHRNVAFYNCDVFGVNFFHILTRMAKYLNRDLLGAFRVLDIQIPSARDAFGLLPNGFCDDAPSKMVISTTKLGNEGGGPTIISSHPTSQPAVDEEVYKHARLLETARLAFSGTLLEDFQGRNGLQCIAEALLTITATGNIILPWQKNKRKRDEIAMYQWYSSPLTLRYELVQNLLHVGKVDVNNYDKYGNNVLMAFVAHLDDGEDDKALTKLLQLLINNGADIHRRNRRGETALHVAVRLGRKIATKVLLENGANVHARTIEGKGVLAVGEEHSLGAVEDQHLYSSILACMAIAIRCGAVAAPDLVREWSLSSVRGCANIDS
jgi:hypothetical protein